MEGISLPTDEWQRRLAAAEARASAAEAELREGDASHRLLLGRWAQAVWETDAAGVVVADSPSWRAYTGQTLEEWLGYGWLDAIHPDDRAYTERQWREAMAAISLVDAEFRLRAPGGGWRWTNVRAAPVFDAAGAVDKWLGINIDIDDRKRAEAALLESEERYRALFESMDEAYAVVEVMQDATGRWHDFLFLQANPAFLTHTGMPYPVGRTATDLLGTPNPAWAEVYGRVAETGEPARWEDGEPTIGRVFDLNAFRLGGPGSRRVAVLFTDITERKRTEAALRESEEQQAFLLKLSDALRPVDDPIAVQEVTTRLLGEAMRVDRSYYAEFDWPCDILHIHHEYVRTGAVSAIGSHPISAFKDLLQFSHEGRPLVCDAIAEHPVFKSEKDAYRARGTDGFILVPLVKQGVMAACLCVTMETPRAWTQSEVGLVADVAERTWAAVERARAEASLRKGEERQALLLRLSDAFRAKLDPVRIQEEAVRLLGESLGADRALYAEFVDNDDGRFVDIDREYRTEGMRSFAGRHRTEQFGSDGPDLKAGRVVAVDDIELEDVSEAQRAVWHGLGVRARMGVPLVKGGRPVICLGVHSARPRIWTADDVALVREIGERTWEAVQRAHAEEALRESEMRFREFGENSSDALWIVDAETMTLDYLSPAFERIWGESRDALMADLSRWAALVHPDDRAAAAEAMPRLLAGGSYVAEYRIVRPDGEMRWIRDTGFPIKVDGVVRRGGGIAQDVTDLMRAQQRQETLLAELQHRVRNILAVTRSIISRSNDGERSTEEYVQHLQGRIAALARTQVLLTRSAGAGIDLENLIRDELLAQVASPDQVSLEGVDVALPPKVAEVLTLAIHELATNATKYGAFSRPGGRLDVRWRVEIRGGQDWLVLDWQERGVPLVNAAPRRHGFGTELISRRIPYELKGHGSLELKPSGVESHIEFPLMAGESILQTDAGGR